MASVRRSSRIRSTQVTTGAKSSNGDSKNINVGKRRKGEKEELGTENEVTTLKETDTSIVITDSKNEGSRAKTAATEPKSKAKKAKTNTKAKVKKNKASPSNSPKKEKASPEKEKASLEKS
mmetsp:Transcript_21259/g.29804  ORF Transcript_21259/g.29804 Transcript_21259/m.29804 type:complete len:121 (+) Transcript_21259:275-637(+)